MGTRHWNGHLSGTGPEGWEKMWHLWTSIVSRADRMHWGDGWMVEPVEGHTGYIIVYVG
jgi:hypothetical protein